MADKLTELVFILDRSGSMAGLEADTIGGYNAVLTEQQAAPGEVLVTTVLFDHEYELLHRRADLRTVKPLTEQEYFVRGSTALLDTMGTTIAAIKAAHRVGGHPPARVLFTIITDGMENSSREYTYPQIKQMVEEQRKEHGWEFIFLGANIDAFAVAGRMGISADMTANFHADAQGVRLNYQVVNEAVSDFRCDRLCADWKRPIEEDYRSRKK